MSSLVRTQLNKTYNQQYQFLDYLPTYCFTAFTEVTKLVIYQF